LESDVDIVAPDLDAMTADGLERRQAERPAGADVESGAMARTADLAPFEEVSLGERTAIVRANIVDRVVLTVEIEHCDRPAVDVHEDPASRRKLGSLRHDHKV
jgi:hypothetical protein